MPYFLYESAARPRAVEPQLRVVMDSIFAVQRVRRAPIVLVQTVIAVEEDDAVSGARAGDPRSAGTGAAEDGDVVIVRGRRRDVARAAAWTSRERRRGDEDASGTVRSRWTPRWTTDR